MYVDFMHAARLPSVVSRSRVLWHPLSIRCSW